MADTPQTAPQESQTPLFDMSKATPISQPADKPLFDMSKATPIAQPIVTNLSGQQMPADVAARHARANAGIPADEQARRAGFAPEAGESGLTGLAVGVGKTGLKTAQGAVKLVNMALPHSSGFGDLQIPVPAAGEDTTSYGVMENVGEMGENITEFAAGDAALKGVLKSVDIMSKIPQAMRTIAEAHPKLLKEIIKSSAKGATVGGVQGGVKGAADNQALEGAEGGAVGGAIGGAAGEMTGTVLKTGAKAVGIGTTAEEDAMRAAKPNKRNFKFSDSFKKAAPLLDEQSGGEAKTLKDWTSVSKEARDKLWTTEVKPLVDRHASEIMDTQPVADAIRKMKTGPMVKYSPEEAAKIEDFAKQFDKGASGVPIGEAEETVEHFNKELRRDGYYRKTADEQNAALTDGNTAARVAAVESMRDQLYTHLENAGETNIRELKDNYGALRNFENEVRGQVNVVGRQASISLKQMMGMTAGMLHGGPVGAAIAAIPIVDKVVNEPGRVLTRGITKAAREAAGKTPSVVGKGVDAVAGAAPKVGAVGASQIGQWIAIQGSDGKKYEVHPEDLAEAKKRDPKLQVIQ